MKIESIEILSDEEIINIIHSEQTRLGNSLVSFEITWFRAEFEYRLELDSKSDMMKSQKWGHTFCLGTAPLENFVTGENVDSLDRVIVTGKRLRNRLRYKLNGNRLTIKCDLRKG